MNEFRRSIDIDAPLERVWNATIDIEGWPAWTPTVTRARRLGSSPIGAGSRVLIEQPKLPPALWVVSAVQEGRRMILKSGLPGMRVIAQHDLEPQGAGCRVTLSVRFEGLFGGLLARWTGGLNDRYLELEANGLKQYCENPGPGK
jgi:carbon monoxide dehydrogenase subunit G